MSDEPSSIEVAKVGGSLLDWPGLPRALEDWLAARDATRPVLVVGGGAMVDVLRALDATHSIGEVRSHQLAVRALDVTCHLLADLVSSLVAVSSLDDLPVAWKRGRVPVLAPRVFLDSVDRAGPDPLPRCWSATSDSIAARIASHLRAYRLDLLKSTSPARPITRAEAAAGGLVDPIFPRASAGIRTVVMVNLRASPPTEVELR